MTDDTPKLRLPVRLADSELGTILDADGNFIARTAGRELGQLVVDRLNKPDELPETGERSPGAPHAHEPPPGEDSDAAKLADSYDLDVKAEALRNFATLIDKGPAIPLPPSVYSALAREAAGDAEAEAEQLRDSVPHPEPRQCQVVDVDGQPALVQTDGRPLGEDDQRKLADVARVLREKHAEEQRAYVSDDRIDLHITADTSQYERELLRSRLALAVNRAGREADMNAIDAIIAELQPDLAQGRQAETTLGRVRAALDCRRNGEVGVQDALRAIDRAVNPRTEEPWL